MTRLILIVGTLLVLLVGCSSTISRDEVIEIASSQIPPEYLFPAKELYRAYFDEELGKNGTWIVQPNGMGITREELEQFGWQEGDNVSFGNTLSGTNEYDSVLIYIDGKTGEIISKRAAGLWLGPLPKEASKGLTTGWIIFIVVASIIFNTTIVLLLWRKIRVSKRHQ